MTKKLDTKAVFLDTKDGIVYNKLFGGLPFEVTKLEDRTIKVKVGDEPTDICAAQENEYGEYFITSLYGGKGFISFRPSKSGEGDYCLFKLNETCALPPPVAAQPREAAPAKKKYASKSPW